LIDNTIGRNKKNWLGNFKELGRVGNFQSFNNQNAITNTWVRDVYSKNEYAIPNYMTRQVFNIKLNARL
jgi:CRISPR/Cas system CSM-associated protein Csm2 small subunit